MVFKFSIFLISFLLSYWFWYFIKVLPNLILFTASKVWSKLTIFNLLNEQKKVVTANILYLKKLGVSNYKEIFIRYADLFLMDNSNFVEIFDKYDKEDLITKLENNVDIFAYL